MADAVGLLVHFFAAATALGALVAPSAALADGEKKAVYTITNATSGNEVLVFQRSANGALTPAGSFATGGTGTGTGLGSGHSLVVSDDGQELVVVNAGSRVRLAAEVADRVPGVRVQVIDLDRALDSAHLSERVVAVPTYVLDDRVVSLANPSRRSGSLGLSKAIG